VSNQDSGISEPSSVDTGIHNTSLQIDEQEVADYLRRHPRFFEDKPSLLADLRVPHQTGNAVSLVERQVATLRESNENRQAQLDELIQIARDNDRLNSHLHQLTLQLMEAGELDVLLTIISDRLKHDFDADLVSIHLLCSPVSGSDSDLSEFVADAGAFNRLFKRVLGGAKPYCGRLKDEQLQTLFADRAEDVGSSALLPLGNEGSLGLLAIGSLERNRFTLGTDTHFLARMSEIMSAALGKHLKN
jgi:uncharacterized protein YigA (DUF484 family)